MYEVSLTVAADRFESSFNSAQSEIHINKSPDCFRGRGFCKALRKRRERLFFVAVLFGGYRSQCAEEAVLFFMDTSGEEQSRRGAGASVVPEGQGP